MRLYEEIIRERSLKGSERRNQLLDLEKSRAYQLRIEQLLTDIKSFDSRIGGLEGKIGGLDGDYRNKVENTKNLIHTAFIDRLDTLMGN